MRCSATWDQKNFQLSPSAKTLVAPALQARFCAIIKVKELVYLDPKAKLAQSLRSGIPTTLLIDRNTHLIGRFEGPLIGTAQM